MAKAKKVKEKKKKGLDDGKNEKLNKFLDEDNVPEDTFTDVDRRG